MRTPQAKSVAFDLPDSPERAKQRREEEESAHRRDEDDRDGVQSDGEGRRRRRRRKHRHHDRGSDEIGTSSSDAENRSSRRHSSYNPSSGPRRPESPDSVDSGETVELPPRFDVEGRRMPERGDDPLADRLDDLLNGRGVAGGLLKKLTGDILGGDRDSERDGGRRRRRRKR